MIFNIFIIILKGDNSDIIIDNLKLEYISDKSNKFPTSFSFNLNNTSINDNDYMNFIQITNNLHTNTNFYILNGKNLSKYNEYNLKVLFTIHYFIA